MKNFLIIFFLIISACTETQKDKAKLVKCFKDSEIRQLYDCINSRDTNKVVAYFSHESTEIRRIAVYGCGSIEDSLLIPEIEKMLNDENEYVREAAAFSLGQTKSATVAKILRTYFPKEQALTVKQQILESIGKQGNRKDLKYIVDLLFQSSELQCVTGRIWALVRFAHRGIFSDESTKLILTYLTNETPKTIRKIASYYLARLRNIDLEDYSAQLLKLVDNEKDATIKMNIIRALPKIKMQGVVSVLGKILKNPKEDYRVKINTLRALSKINNEEACFLIFEAIDDANNNVSQTASEMLYVVGNELDIEQYLKKAKTVINWRVKSNLLAVALKFAKDDKQKIVNTTKKLIEQSANNYEKAALISGLSAYLPSWEFLHSKITGYDVKIITTTCMETLAEMSRSEAFNEYCDQNKKFKREFAQIFKQAILSGDEALVAIAAATLAEPNSPLLSQFDDFGFLHNALKSCKLPMQIETYIALSEAIEVIMGEKIAVPQNIQNLAIDWKLLQQLDPKQRAVIKTSKGDITIELYVEDAPASVSNFITLTLNEFYNNNPFHRVVPNFVIQGGCPRGDGWGNPKSSIISEFSDFNYTTGTLGMASAGKDTESSQWFITHSDTPHLDGRYSIFGHVISGMSVVHKIEQGDQIVAIQLVAN